MTFQLSSQPSLESDPPSSRAASTRARPVLHVATCGSERIDDFVAVEEPLEIRVVAEGREWPVTVTMRTPGADEQLALGFLVAERVIDGVDAVEAIRPCGNQPNLLRVELRSGCSPRLERITRSFIANSSCGLCGKTSLEAVFVDPPEMLARNDFASVTPEALQRIPARLRDSQRIFDRTGGLHAVASFTTSGELIAAFEDVGRHNAFDKLVGATLLAGERHFRNRIIALSGRAGFELLQKAAMVGAPVVAAIGAPSSLAVELADRAGITLVGFLRPAGFNVYTHGQRIVIRSARQEEAR